MCTSRKVIAKEYIKELVVKFIDRDGNDANMRSVKDALRRESLLKFIVMVESDVYGIYLIHHEKEWMFYVPEKEGMAFVAVGHYWTREERADKIKWDATMCKNRFGSNLLDNGDEAENLLEIIHKKLEITKNKGHITNNLIIPQVHFDNDGEYNFVLVKHNNEYYLWAKRPDGLYGDWVTSFNKFYNVSALNAGGGRIHVSSIDKRITVSIGDEYYGYPDDRIVLGILKQQFPNYGISKI